MDNHEKDLAPEELAEQEELLQDTANEEKGGYHPRPKGQVWAARIGLVAFIIVVIVYYMVYFRGGR